MAEWQSGHAADCKSVYAGSIPTSASMYIWGTPCLLLCINISLRKITQYGYTQERADKTISSINPKTTHIHKQY